MCMSELDRVLARSAEQDCGHDTPCWIWLGPVSPTGYGRAKAHGKYVGVHRITYTVMVNEIPDGLHLDHLCRVRSCVNPWHVEPVTRKVNTMRGESPIAAGARRSHCPQGHPLSGHNLKTDSRGWRSCIACARRRTRLFMQRKRAATHV